MGRRLTDLIISLLGLIILSPLLIILTLVNAVGLPGNPFFAQKRVGRGGKRFTMLKFRTMRCGAEQQGQLTVGKDQRITRFGSFLRRYKLDELPQLLNVLMGSMSLVGPRPEVPKYVALYDDEQREGLRWKPGLTDPASLRYINESALLATFDDPEEAYVRQIMPDKLRINLEYLKTRTWRSDMRVLMQTLGRIVRGSSLPRS